MLRLMGEGRLFERQGDHRFLRVYVFKEAGTHLCLEKVM